jgi:hypothetical protein
MSKKYVPSFIKDQQPVPTANTNSFRTGPPSTPSIPPKLAPLPVTTSEAKPIVNTSLPAKNAPKLAPATLASLTGGPSIASNGTSSGSKISFASKFKEQVRIAEDPNYKPPPKVVDVTSESDFPSLGAPKKAPAGAWGAKPSIGDENKPAAPSFADKAKDWANKKREEEEKVRLKAAQEEERLYKAQLMKSLPSLMRRFKTNDYDYNDDDDEDYNQNCDQSSLGGDSYEVPENDQPLSEEEEEEENEFNQNVGWDGRRKDDLY